MEKGITTHLKRLSPVSMTNTLVNFRKICSLSLVWLVSLEASLENTPKKAFLQLNHWRFNRKAKCLVVVAIVGVLLVSVFAFLPKQSVGRGNVVPQNSDNSTATPSPTATTQSKGSLSSNLTNPFNIIGNIGSAQTYIRPPGLIQSAQTINSTVWMEVAANAWAYFQPGAGVDLTTGLPYAVGASFTGFTDWDLGCYIQAIIDAQELNLTTTVGAWGSSARIDMVLTFLENRTLNNATNGNYPFQFYDATTGNVYNSPQEATVDIADTGRLFVALNNLINLNSSLKQRIDNLVWNAYGNRSAYNLLVPGIMSDSRNSVNIYSYYVYSGFASFFPSISNAPSTILANIFSAGTVTYGNVSLPEASISGDPLLCSIFELNNNDSRLLVLSKQVYLASEAYYNATGQYAAFSEGNGYKGVFIDEWVVLPNGATWVITAAGSSSYLSIDPVIYNKVAFGFLALYNTTYARNMLIYLEQNLPDPTSGYADGASNYGELISAVGSNTNGLILDAALYAIQNNP
jgi:hypothetical protein